MEPHGEASSSMEVDQDESMPSLPSSPLPVTPGAFRDVNGGMYDDRANGDDSPVPPPHGPYTTSSPPPHTQPPQPTIDAEACKSLGNKYFIAKDYKKAIKEYTRGAYLHPTCGRDVGLLGVVVKRC